MRKFLCLAAFSLISAFSLADVEVTLVQDYSRSIFTGATKKSNEKVGVHIVNEVPKLTDWDYVYGFEYQFKDKKNEQEIVPRVGLRYYPVNFIPVYASTNLGVEIMPDSNRYATMAEVGVGLGREDVIGGWYISMNDLKRISTGIRIGYKF